MADPTLNVKQQLSALDQLKITQAAVSGATHKLTEEQRKLASAISYSSDAIGRGKITLDNFGIATDNAIRKVLLWQIAIEAVYGVRRRITEMITTWKDLELTLSRISITTGAVGDNLYKYFQQVADIAVEFGMPIDQTLKGMDLALRATARITDATKREQTAVQLLKDTSILANLSGMQYSQSIDIMVGSLRQMGMGLEEGGKLLDKWVKVSKNAAVSVNDLAQGFAIMADAAKEAGMNADQVNGVIAALSETVTLGPVEVGNAIRALMSTLYNTESINLMSRFGVAIEDTTGNARSFWDIMSQLAAMRMEGVLSESQWLALARGAGGGARRYAQFLALLSNWNTAMKIAAISATAQGDAAEANRKIVDTLANSFDKFKASQQRAFMALGAQTGVISDISDVLKALTKIITWFSNAPKPFYDIARAIIYLGGVMAAAKIGKLLLEWTNLIPKLAALSTAGKMGGFAGAHKAVTLLPFPEIGRTKGEEVPMYGAAMIKGTAQEKTFGEWWIKSGLQGALETKIKTKVAEIEKEWSAYLKQMSELPPEEFAQNQEVAKNKALYEYALADAAVNTKLTSEEEAVFTRALNTEVGLLAGTMTQTQALTNALRSSVSLLTMLASSILNLPPMLKLFGRTIPSIDKSIKSALESRLEKVPAGVFKKLEITGARTEWYKTGAAAYAAGGGFPPPLNWQIKQISQSGAAVTKTFQQQMGIMKEQLKVSARSFGWQQAIKDDWQRFAATTKGIAKSLTAAPTNRLGAGVSGAMMGGAVAYGITKNAWSGIGATIAGGIGSAINPIAGIFGTIAGAVIGKIAAESFMSHEEKIRRQMTAIGKVLKIDITDKAMEFYKYQHRKEKQKEEGPTLEYPQINRSAWDRAKAGITGWWKGLTGDYEGAYNDFQKMVKSTKFKPEIGKEEFERGGQWAIKYMEQMKDMGYATAEEVQTFKEAGGALDTLTEAQRFLIPVLYGASQETENLDDASKEVIETFKVMRDYYKYLKKDIQDMIDAENRYVAQQKRIKEIIKDYDLLEKEARLLANTLANLSFTPFEDFGKKMELFSIGFSVSYASFLELIEKTPAAFESFGGTTFFDDLNEKLKYASEITGTGITDVEKMMADLQKTVDTIDFSKFAEVSEYYPEISAAATKALNDFYDRYLKIAKLKKELPHIAKDILEKPEIENMDLNNMDDYVNLIEKLNEQKIIYQTQQGEGWETYVAEIDRALEYVNAAKEAVPGLANVFLTAYMEIQKMARVQKPVEFEVVASKDWEDQLKLFAKAKEIEIQLKQDPLLSKYLDQSTKVSLLAINAENMNTAMLETNSLALSMAREAMEDNTKAVAGLEAEYNIPAGYAVPSTFWAKKYVAETTGKYEAGPLSDPTLWAIVTGSIAQMEESSRKWKEYVDGLVQPEKEPTTVEEPLDEAVTDIENNSAAITYNTVVLDKFSWGIKTASDQLVSFIPADVAAKMKNFDEWLASLPTLNAPSTPKGIIPKDVWSGLGSRTQEIAAELGYKPGEVSDEDWERIYAQLLKDILGRVNIPNKQFGGNIHYTGLYKLHAGEYVIPKHETRSNLDVVRQLGTIGTFAVTENLLANIKQGIASLHNDLQILNQSILRIKVEGTEFSKVAGGGTVNVGATYGR